MAHEKQGDTREELDKLAAMLRKRIEELETRKAFLEAELRLVEEKRKTVQR